MEESYLYDATLLSIKVVLLAVSGYRSGRTCRWQRSLFESNADTAPTIYAAVVPDTVVFGRIIKENRESIHCLTARRGRKKKRTVNQLGFEAALRQARIAGVAHSVPGMGKVVDPVMLRRSTIASTLADMLKKEFGATRRSKVEMSVRG
jgi:hypothetical protein